MITNNYYNSCLGYTIYINQEEIKVWNIIQNCSSHGPPLTVHLLSHFLFQVIFLVLKKKIIGIFPMSIGIFAPVQPFIIHLCSKNMNINFLFLVETNINLIFYVMEYTLLFIWYLLLISRFEHQSRKK